MLLIKDIWKLSYDINIYECRFFYREVNRITDYLTKKGIDIILHTEDIINM